MKNYIKNKYLIIPFIAALISQTIKVIIETKRYHKLNIKRFFDGMGGMPSTHSTLTSSLTTIIYLNYGVTSILFALSLFFSLALSLYTPCYLSTSLTVLNISFMSDKKPKFSRYIRLYFIFSGKIVST